MYLSTITTDFSGNPDVGGMKINIPEFIEYLVKGWHMIIRKHQTWQLVFHSSLQDNSCDCYYA